MIVFFWVLAVLLIASAVWVITASKPVYSVVGLLINFTALAMLYLTLSAEFLAVIQLIVYSGAILILFLFVIALLSSGTKPFEAGPDKIPKILIPASAFVAITLIGTIVAVAQRPQRVTPSTPTSTPGAVGTANVFGSVHDFGAALFTTSLLPFEITAFILMVAVIGVVVLAGEKNAPPSLSRLRLRDIRRKEREAIVREGR